MAGFVSWIAAKVAISVLECIEAASFKKGQKVTEDNEGKEENPPSSKALRRAGPLRQKHFGGQALFVKALRRAGRDS